MKWDLHGTEKNVGPLRLFYIYVVTNPDRPGDYVVAAGGRVQGAANVDSKVNIVN